MQTCERCEKSEAEVKARGADMLHLCTEWPDGSFCPERDDGECFSYRCSDCNEGMADDALGSFYGSSSPQTLDERHAEAWALKGERS